jgi:hypothetical protein
MASVRFRPSENEGLCTCPLRINTTGSPIDCHKSKKASMSGLSWPLSGPLTPGHALEACRVDTRRHLRSPHRTASHPLLAYPPTGWGHGGTRTRSTSRSVQTWSVSPATIAGVQGRHCLAEPVPWVSSG